MKSIRFIPAMIIVASLALSACSAIGYSFAAPTVANTTVQSESSNTTTLSVPVSAPLASAPAAASNLQIPTNVAALQSAYESIYQNVNPSVVTIDISSQVSTSSRSRSLGGQGNGQSSQGQIVPTAEGSGFIWDTAGHIVTNNHVVDGAAKISVVFSNGASYDAKLVGTDPNNDLAVIQVTGAPASLLKPVTVGDSSKVQVGQMVVAIGNPFGLGNTMTNGIVSATGRQISSDVNSNQTSLSSSSAPMINDVIQTDAAINPGNSGGVLLDMNGNFIGVPSQIESESGSNSGVGFAISSATVKQVVPQLIAKGNA